MKGFKQFLREQKDGKEAETLGRRPQLSAEPAELVAVDLGQDFPEEADLRIFIWDEGTDENLLIEAPGNKNVKLVGQYYCRYDPPRTASTGKGQTPKGDWHLLNNKQEIAAWDMDGKARHGFPSGTKLPRKAYDALIKKYPNATGLKGRLLEEILAKHKGKSLLT